MASQVQSVLKEIELFSDNVYNSVTYRSQLLSNVVIRSESSTQKVSVKTGI